MNLYFNYVVPPSTPNIFHLDFCGLYPQPPPKTKAYVREVEEVWHFEIRVPQ